VECEPQRTHQHRERRGLVSVKIWPERAD
jgi:hypothetical protein